MAAFFCDNCGEPNRGNVTEGICVDCLMGIEGRDGHYCKFCEVPIDSGDAGFEELICDECQEDLDIKREIEDVDLYEYGLDQGDLCTQQDEEFLRGPTF